MERSWPIMSSLLLLLILPIIYLRPIPIFHRNLWRRCIVVCDKSTTLLHLTTSNMSIIITTNTLIIIMVSSSMFWKSNNNSNLPSSPLLPTIPLSYPTITIMTSQHPPPPTSTSTSGRSRTYYYPLPPTPSQNGAASNQGHATHPPPSTPATISEDPSNIFNGCKHK